MIATRSTVLSRQKQLSNLFYFPCHCSPLSAGLLALTGLANAEEKQAEKSSLWACVRMCIHDYRKCQVEQLPGT